MIAVKATWLASLFRYASEMAVGALVLVLDETTPGPRCKVARYRTTRLRGTQMVDFPRARARAYDTETPRSVFRCVIAGGARRDFSQDFTGLGPTWPMQLAMQAIEGFRERKTYP